jgi:hypothetical protein
MELADTSAWTNRGKDPRVGVDFLTRMADGEIATCPMVMMEPLWTARDRDEFETMRFELEALPQLPIDAAVWSRATDVFQSLAAEGALHYRRATPRIC